MERASTALVRTEYFTAERLCLRALDAAWAARDLDRMERICLPLQEARRQIRQIATDAAEAGSLHTLSNPSDLPSPPRPGFYLVQPPLIGADARRLRELMWGQHIPALVLAREPMTRAGRWPIVAVGDVSVRVQVEPPPGVVWTGEGMRRDRAELPLCPAWFLRASESLGDSGFAMVDPALPAIWRVEDLLRVLDACPDHEKLHQHLAEACRIARFEPAPAGPRPRVDTHPNSF